VVLLATIAHSRSCRNHWPELGYLNLLAYAWQWDSDPGALKGAAELADKAIALDDSHTLAYMVRSYVAAFTGKRDQAIADIQRAISLDPNSALVWSKRADINNILNGKPEETLVYLQKSATTRSAPSRDGLFAGRMGLHQHASLLESD
jgi:tetratricopeptide (TPR) repeat protein